MDYWDPPVSRVVAQHVEKAHPTPWRVVNDWIEDANGTNIVQKPYGYRGVWERAARRIVEAVNQSKFDPETTVEERVEEPLPPPEFVQPNADDGVPF